LDIGADSGGGDVSKRGASGGGLGIGLRARYGDREGSKFDDAGLAFVGLLLAFTFGMSLAKHDHRRDMVVADSDAIGDFYTCARMLKETVQNEAADRRPRYLVVGREKGLAGRIEVAGTLSYILLMTLAVYVTLDLNHHKLA
jgi:hypothetical protein